VRRVARRPAERSAAAQPGIPRMAGGVPLGRRSLMYGREELRRRKASADAGGGEARTRKQHESGKLSARERIDLLLDPGTFVETGKLVRHQCHDFGMAKHVIDGDGVVTGYGAVEGRTVYVFAQDFT